MTIQQYDEYKDSGIAWLGQIPQHWEVKRIKNFVSQKTTASTTELKIGLENIESKSGRYIETDTEFEGNGIAFEVGDIVYGKLRPYLQKVWLAEFSGNAVGDFFVFQAQESALNIYIKYLFLSDGFTQETNNSTFGAKMPRVSIDFIRSLPCALPPLTEQEAIVRYLDERCDEVDGRIELEKKRIELLTELKQSIITQAVTEGLDPNAPKRDSGVQWLGQIPQHWEVIKLKFVTNKIKSGGTPTSGNTDYYAEEGIPWVTIADMSNVEVVKETESRITEQGMLSKSLELHPQGTLLYSIYATIGKVALLGIPATTNQAILAIYVKHQTIENNFLRVVLIALEPVVLSETSSNTQSNLSASKISNFILPLPPLTEQEAIVRYLDEQCDEVDKRIERAKRKIELLTELKQSIITEAVTGKIKVC